MRASIAALEALDHAYFSRRLPAREHWRAWPEFRGKVAFLDIETTGLDIGRDALTVVGVYDGVRRQSFVRGVNLEDLPRALAARRLLVTFNGLRFDVPFLRRGQAKKVVNAPQLPLEDLSEEVLDIPTFLRRQAD